jgi:hypothetical protein
MTVFVPVNTSAHVNTSKQAGAPVDLRRVRYPDPAETSRGRL